MNITIEIHFKSDSDSKIMKRGSFPVNVSKFNKDQNREAARVAFEWWKQIKHENSYRIKIEKVTYDEINNITELVKQLDNAPIPDLDLPF